jgi:hypothetical protein
MRYEGERGGFSRKLANQVMILVLLFSIPYYRKHLLRYGVCEVVAAM